MAPAAAAKVASFAAVGPGPRPRPPLPFCAYFARAHLTSGVIITTLSVLLMPAVHLSRGLALRAGCQQRQEHQQQQLQSRSAIFLGAYDQAIVRDFPFSSSTLGRALYTLLRRYPFSFSPLARLDLAEVLYVGALLACLLGSLLIRRILAASAGSVAEVPPAPSDPHRHRWERRAAALRHFLVAVVRLSIHGGALLTALQLWGHRSRQAAAMLPLGSCDYLTADNWLRICFFSLIMDLGTLKLPLEMQLPLSVVQTALAFATTLLCDLMTHGSPQQPVATLLQLACCMVVAPAALLYVMEHPMRLSYLRSGTTAGAQQPETGSGPWPGAASFSADEVTEGQRRWPRRPEERQRPRDDGGADVAFDTADSAWVVTRSYGDSCCIGGGSQPGGAVDSPCGALSSAAAATVAGGGASTVEGRASGSPSGDGCTSSAAAWLLFPGGVPRGADNGGSCILSANGGRACAAATAAIATSISGPLLTLDNRTDSAELASSEFYSSGGDAACCTSAVQQDQELMHEPCECITRLPGSGRRSGSGGWPVFTDPRVGASVPCSGGDDARQPLETVAVNVASASTAVSGEADDGVIGTPSRQTNSPATAAGLAAAKSRAPSSSTYEPRRPTLDLRLLSSELYGNDASHASPGAVGLAGCHSMHAGEGEPRPAGGRGVDAACAGGDARRRGGSDVLYTSRLSSAVVSVKVSSTHPAAGGPFPLAAAALTGAAGGAVRAFNAAAVAAAARNAGSVRLGGGNRLMRAMGSGVVVHGCVHLIHVVRFPRSPTAFCGNPDRQALPLPLRPYDPMPPIISIMPASLCARAAAAVDITADVAAGESGSADEARDSVPYGGGYDRPRVSYDGGTTDSDDGHWSPFVSSERHAMPPEAGGSPGPINSGGGAAGGGGGDRGMRLVHLEVKPGISATGGGGGSVGGDGVVGPAVASEPAWFQRMQWSVIRDAHSGPLQLTSPAVGHCVGGVRDADCDSDGGGGGALGWQPLGNFISTAEPLQGSGSSSSSALCVIDGSTLWAGRAMALPSQQQAGVGSGIGVGGSAASFSEVRPRRASLCSEGSATDDAATAGLSKAAHAAIYMEERRRRYGMEGAMAAGERHGPSRRGASRAGEGGLVASPGRGSAGMAAEAPAPAASDPGAELHAALLGAYERAAVATACAAAARGFCGDTRTNVVGGAGNSGGGGDGDELLPCYLDAVCVVPALEAANERMSLHTGAGSGGGGSGASSRPAPIRVVLSPEAVAAVAELQPPPAVASSGPGSRVDRGGDVSGLYVRVVVARVGGGGGEGVGVVGGDGDATVAPATALLLLDEPMVPLRPLPLQGAGAGAVAAVGAWSAACLEVALPEAEQLTAAAGGAMGVFVHLLAAREGPTATDATGASPHNQQHQQNGDSKFDRAAAPMIAQRLRNRVLVALPLLLVADPAVAAELAAAYDEHAAAIFYDSGATDEELQPHLPYSASRLAAYRDHLYGLVADVADLFAQPPAPSLEMAPSAPAEVAPSATSVRADEVQDEAAGPVRDTDTADTAAAEAVATGEQLLSYMCGRGMWASARLIVSALRERWGVEVVGDDVLAGGEGGGEEPAAGRMATTGALVLLPPPFQAVDLSTAFSCFSPGTPSRSRSAPLHSRRPMSSDATDTKYCVNGRGCSIAAAAASTVDTSRRVTGPQGARGVGFGLRRPPIHARALRAPAVDAIALLVVFFPIAARWLGCSRIAAVAILGALGVVYGWRRLAPGGGGSGGGGVGGGGGDVFLPAHHGELVIQRDEFQRL